MSSSIKIGVVIVNYNSNAYLLKALKALSAQTLLPRQVIVYDNASVEEVSSEIYNFNLPLTLIKAPENTGFSGGNNRAIKELTPEINWIALLNPDAYPTPNWLEEMVKAIVDYPEYVFFGSKLICESEPFLLDGTGDAYHISGKAWRMNHKKNQDSVKNKVQEIFSPCAAAALYRRDVYEEINGFDERFFCYYEDTDLAFRLRLIGYRCGYIPTAMVFHTGSATTTRYSEFCTYHGHRNLVWTYAKNMPLPLLIIFLPLHALLNLFSIGLCATRGQFKTILKAKYDAFKGFDSVIAHRKIWQKKRKVSLFNLLKIFHKGLPL